MDKHTIDKAACVGAGVIGSGWATVFALKGLPVSVYDVNPESLERSSLTVGHNLDFLAEHGLISHAEASDRKAKISYTAVLFDAVKGAGFIQESCPESYDAKTRTLAELERLVEGDAIIATSTSGLLVTRIAKDAIRPERVVGGHPYNPPHLIPLVEIMRGERTSDQTVARAKVFYADMGMEPIVLRKESLGFISNRLQLALYREAIDLVTRGVCTVEDVDKATMYGIGLRYAVMGPNLIYHLGAGDRGIKGLLSNLHDSSAARLRDLASWVDEPMQWPELAEAGVLEEIANRDTQDGKTIPELIKYRDDMLIALLKLHKKV